jgi:OOP family OmpA-OmpF porin
MRTPVMALVAALTAAIPLSTWAADRGFYAGIGLGSVDAEDYPSFAELTDESTDPGFKVFVGYQALPWLAVEIDYTDLGKASATSVMFCIPEDPYCGGHYDQDGRSITLTALPGFAVGPVDFFARAGVSHWRSTLTFRTTPAIDIFESKRDGDDFLFGLGAHRRVRAFGLRIEGTRFDLGGRDFDLYSLGATWHFGG